MSQTRMRSWKEAWTNIFIGYSINFVANIFILPAFGFNSLTLTKNFFIGVIYTGISLLRTYCVRRWYNRNDGKEV